MLRRLSLAGLFMLVCCAGPKILPDDPVIHLSGVQFEKDTAILRSQSFKALDQVYDFMAANPDPRYEVACFVYSESSDSLSNVMLANRRAKEVKKYLVKKGLNYDRMVLRGYHTGSPARDKQGRIDNTASNWVEFRKLEQMR